MRFFFLNTLFFYEHALYWAEAERAQQNLIFEAKMCLNACLSFIDE